MRFVGLVLVVACVLGVAPARAETGAKELAELALKKVSEDQDYLGAMDLFAKAFALSNDPQYLLDSGIAARRANLPQQAVVAYRRYLALLGPAIAREMHDQLIAEIEVITRASASLVVRTAGAPAEIELDRRPAGTASKDAPLVVLAPAAGALIHALRASRPGFVDAIRDVGNLAPDTTTELVLEPTLGRTTARITFASVPSGATLTSPAHLTLARTPQTLEIAPGDYEVTAHLADHDDRSQNVRVIAGEDRELVFHLAATPTWWHRHRAAVAIGAAAVVIVTGILVAPAVNDYFKPDAYIIDYHHPR